MIAAKEKITETRRIGKIRFTSIAIIGGKVYSNYHQNMNNDKYLLSIIITLGKMSAVGIQCLMMELYKVTWLKKLML